MKLRSSFLALAAVVSFGTIPSAFAQIMIDPSTIMATAGSTFDDTGTFDVSNLLDGQFNEGNRDAHAGTHYLALQGNLTETVTFDLGGTYSLTALKVLNTSNTGWNDSETDFFTIATSSDGTTYSAPSASIPLQDFTEGFQTVPLSEENVSHVQLVITNEGLNDQGTTDVRVGLNEVQFEAVPEPSVAAFLGLALFSLVNRRKR